MTHYEYVRLFSQALELYVGKDVFASIMMPVDVSFKYMKDVLPGQKITVRLWIAKQVDHVVSAVSEFINPETKTADKCTWCYHRVRKGLLPACVNVCPVQARKFGDLNDHESEVYKILHQPHVISVLKPDMGNKPSLHYVGLRREVV